MHGFKIWYYVWNFAVGNNVLNGSIVYIERDR